MALIDGLSGKAAYRNGVVKLSFPQDYIGDTVRKLTDNYQTPTISKITGSGDFNWCWLRNRFFWNYRNYWFWGF